MLEHIFKLLENEDEEIQLLIKEVLELEQQYISYELRGNSSKLKEIKQNIRDITDELANNGYEIKRS